MQIVHEKSEALAHSRQARRSGRVPALVPTMGALHEGHLALVDKAKKLADHVTVSIFVNPTQFGEGEDLSRYPRDLEADVEQLDRLGVDVVFAPSVEEMYPENATTIVHVEGADRHLCGRFRPGHFKGVTTVVAKLFTVCEPDYAVFGLKDAQQFLIIRKMVRDLGMAVEVVGVTTVREPDGLAMSSRNAFLGRDEREQAVVLSKAVFAARDLILAGERDPDAVRARMHHEIAAASLARLQYADVVETSSITPVESIGPGDGLLAATAVFLGETRLIDNQFIVAPV